MSCDGPTVKVEFLSDTRCREVNRYGKAIVQEMNDEDIKSWRDEETKMREFEIDNGNDFEWNYDHRFPHWAEILPSGKIKILNCATLCTTKSTQTSR